MKRGTTKSKRTKSNPLKVRDLFGDGHTGNLLQGKYHTDPVYGWFQNRHTRGVKLIDDDGFYHTHDERGEHKWKVPIGVRLSLKQPLIHAQMANRYPWYVTWVSPKTGKRLKKYFSSAVAGIDFITAKAQYVDSKACLVSRHGYDVPAPLRGKIPKPWKWCPGCMSARKYRRVLGSDGSPTVFHAMVKTPTYDKRGNLVYEYTARPLALMRCTYCGFSNRDVKFRRSNQPWEKRKFKRGVTRARRTRRRR